MRLQIEPSQTFVTINGATCRVWNGVTEDNEQVFVFVVALMTRVEMEGLIEKDPPRATPAGS